MASVTFNFTPEQTARIQEAVAIYNQRRGTNLTPKQWGYQVIRAAVAGQLSGQAEEAARVVRDAIIADMQGEA